MSDEDEEIRWLLCPQCKNSIPHISHLIKPKKWVYKKESEEEMNNKYNLLMEKYKKEKNN